MTQEALGTFSCIALQRHSMQPHNKQEVPMVALDISLTELLNWYLNRALACEYADLG